MNVDLGLESLATQESCECSFEELMCDYIETEQSAANEQQIFNTIDHLTFIRDHVAERGVTDTIRDMIGDQISYSSAEELVAKIDASIEGLISKITGDTIDNTLKQIKEFADFFTSYRGERVIASGDMKVKFVDLSEGNPIAPFVSGIASSLEKFTKSMMGGVDRAPTEEEILKLLDVIKGYIHTGNMILRNMKLVDMGYEEYKKAYNEMADAAKEVKSKFKMLEMAKLLMPKASTGDILNKLMKNQAATGGKTDKQAFKTFNKPAVLAKYNSLARAALRIIKIILAKGYTLVKQIDKDLNKK